MRRHFQKAVAPVELPAAIRAGLDRARSAILADNFRREEILDSYRPKIAAALAADHVAVAGASNHWYSAAGRVRNSFEDARRHTEAQHAELQRAHLSRAFDEQQIRDYAENYSRICAQSGALERAASLATAMGCVLPSGKNITADGVYARLCDAQWWRRQLRRTWTRRAENVMREIGIVRKGREPYASDDAVMARAQMKAKGRKFLESHEAVNEKGEQLSLFKLAEHSLANPALRRGEFMCRVRGFEEIATDAGHVAMFWTLTAPSAFHAQLAAGQKNPLFIRAAVRDAQAWLCGQWAKVRAKLKRLSILLYGFRIAEPHHDGTPHWHLLLFARPRDSRLIRRVVRGYWTAEHRDELRRGKRWNRRALKARQFCKFIRAGQGSAVGYVAKYVSKNIDGAGAIGEAADDETGGAMANSLRRVDAWASLHGVRQFQQVGGPPVGLWRELRRITEAVDDPDIERARARADVGDWRGFIYAISSDGIRAGRRSSLRIARQATGELTKYAEEKPDPVIGVRWSSVVEITRPHHWRIQRCGTITTPCSDGDHARARDSLAGVASDGPAARSGRHGSGIFGRGLVGLGLGSHSRDQKRKGRRRAAPGADSGLRGVAAAARTIDASSGSFSSIFSDLGPVAITVRERLCGSCGAPAVRGTHRCELPKGTVPVVKARPERLATGETGNDRPAVPFYVWEKRLDRFEREHGRYPDVAETSALWSHHGN